MECMLIVPLSKRVHTPVRAPFFTNPPHQHHPRGSAHERAWMHVSGYVSSFKDHLLREATSWCLVAHLTSWIRGCSHRLTVCSSLQDRQNIQQDSRAHLQSDSDLMTQVVGTHACTRTYTQTHVQYEVCYCASSSRQCSIIYYFAHAQAHTYTHTVHAQVYTWYRWHICIRGFLDQQQLCSIQSLTGSEHQIGTLSCGPLLLHCLSHILSVSCVCVCVCVCLYAIWACITAQASKHSLQCPRSEVGGGCFYSVQRSRKSSQHKYVCSKAPLRWIALNLVSG
jgi:hypothetical protein